MAQLLSVNVGLPREIEWKGKTVRTAVWKDAVRGRRKVGRLNIDGDGQGDLQGHGGEHRAVLVYQIDSYRYWERELGRKDLVFGQFGENFTVDGLPDDEVCIGDRYRIGSALFEVTQPRVTCYRVGIRMDEPRMAALLVERHRPGFYLRVVEVGEVAAGDEIVKVSNGPERMSIAEADALLYLPGHSHAQLERALRIPAFPAGWRSSFQALLQQSPGDGQAKGNPGLVAVSPPPAWPGFRPMRVSRIDREGNSVFSLVLVPADGKPLAPAQPGQFVVLRLPIQSGAPTVLRSYSLSDLPGTEHYRVSIKLEEKGLASTYLHTRIEPGSTLEVSAPRGTFTLRPGSEPIVLLSAGVGATPVLAMLHALADGKSSQPVWWLYGARNREEHPFRDESRALLQQLACGRSYIQYSRPEPADRSGVDFDAAGHLAVSAFDKIGVPRDGQFYLCGPAGFLREITAGLRTWGVAADHIHAEIFGTLDSSSPGMKAETHSPHLPAEPAGSGPQISFARSGLTLPWDAKYQSLLELAEACDVAVRWSCRTGVCHACETALIAGDVEYDPEPLDAPAKPTPGRGGPRPVTEGRTAHHGNASLCNRVNWELPVIVTTFPRTVRVIEHTLIPLKDGTMLAARIWLPDDAEQNPVPAILEYLPYRKRDGTYERDALTHPYLAGHGYAGVRIDMRGCGESAGLLFDEYAKQEQDDGVEVIAWLAAQPWCSGVVGMMGISWGGFNGLQIAARRPPALKAIVTICSTDDRYADDVHYMGGTLLAADGLEWGSFFFGSMCLPPDPVLVGDRWRAMWLERLENVPLFFEPWLQHQRRDAYWKHGSVCEDYAAIQCPVYAVGGWTDAYKNAIPRLLERLSVPRKGLIGPWAHGYPHFARPGPQIGFLQEMLRWWDYWLKGIDTGVMDEPMLRAWMTESVRPASNHPTLPGRWVAEASWPPPGITPQRLVLTDEGLGNEAAHFSARSLCSPLTVGKRSGSWVPFGRGHDQAEDQRDDDLLSLVFDTPPLDRPIEILGAAIVTLDLASDEPMANLVVRLCDVHPSGESLRVSYGVLNLTHRDGHEKPAPLAAGQRYRVRIQLNDAGSVFPAGHRIRLAISTAYWPMLWPAPERATLLISGGTLELPVRAPRPTDALLNPLPGPESAPPEKPTIIHRDHMRIERIDRLGLELGTQVDSKLHLEEDQPLSAAAELRRTWTMSRDAWQIRIETQMRLSCNRDVFLLQGDLRAWEGADEVCHREWDLAIPRDFV